MHKLFVLMFYWLRVNTRSNYYGNDYMSPSEYSYSNMYYNPLFPYQSYDFADSTQYWPSHTTHQPYSWNMYNSRPMPDTIFFEQEMGSDFSRHSSSKRESSSKRHSKCYFHSKKKRHEKSANEYKPNDQPYQYYIPNPNALIYGSDLYFEDSNFNARPSSALHSSHLDQKPKVMQEKARNHLESLSKNQKESLNENDIETPYLPHEQYDDYHDIINPAYWDPINGYWPNMEDYQENLDDQNPLMQPAYSFEEFYPNNQDYIDSEYVQSPVPVDKSELPIDKTNTDKTPLTTSDVDIEKSKKKEEVQKEEVQKEALKNEEIEESEEEERTKLLALRKKKIKDSERAYIKLAKINIYLLKLKKKMTRKKAGESSGKGGADIEHIDLKIAREKKKLEEMLENLKLEVPDEVEEPEVSTTSEERNKSEKQKKKERKIRRKLRREAEGPEDSYGLSEYGDFKHLKGMDKMNKLNKMMKLMKMAWPMKEMDCMLKGIKRHMRKERKAAEERRLEEEKILALEGKANPNPNPTPNSNPTPNPNPNPPLNLNPNSTPNPTPNPTPNSNPNPNPNPNSSSNPNTNK